MNMKIKITKRGHVKVDGVKYKATPARGCYGCAFEPVALQEVCGAAPCMEGMRHSAMIHMGQPVIFVKAESNG
jgi:hypothetical protein